MLYSIYSNVCCRNADRHQRQRRRGISQHNKQFGHMCERYELFRGPLHPILYVVSTLYVRYALEESIFVPHPPINIEGSDAIVYVGVCIFGLGLGYCDCLLCGFVYWSIRPSHARADPTSDRKPARTAPPPLPLPIYTYPHSNAKTTQPFRPNLQQRQHTNTDILHISHIYYI